MAETQEKKNMLQDFTEHLIKSIEQNEAPWQKPWKAGELIHPFNGKTQRHYNGFNNVQLLDLGFNDPRWMTFKQANDLGLQIKRGSKSTKIRFCDFTATLPVEDENGNQVLDADGKPQMEKYLTTSPKVIIYRVFNGTQIDGLEPYVRQEPDWNPVERAEKLLAELGKHSSLEHNQRDAAHLSSPTKIEMPARSSFETAERYYEVAFHEYSHWVAYQGKTAGEVQALQAAYKTPEGRAKEEMIADITCMLLARDLHLGYNPQNNIAYIASWAKMLKDTPFELYRITAEAERRKGQLLGMELEKQQEQSQAASLGEDKSATVVKIDPGIIPVALSDTKALSSWLREEYQGMTVEIADDGTVQQFTRGGLNASVKRRGEEQRQMYAGLDDLVRNAVFSDFEPADARHEGKVAGQNVYYAAANIDDKLFAVRIKIDMPAHEKGIAAYKDHKISEIEIAPSLYNIRSASPNVQEEGAIVKDSGVIPSVRADILAGSVGEELTPSIAAPQQHTSAILKISLAVLKKDVNPSILLDGILSKDIAPQLAEVKTILSVPYSEKNQAKGLGASWDKENKVWFVPVGTDLTAFTKWMPRKEVLLGAEAPSLSAAGELALAIRDLGGDLQGKMPEMDGKIHRISILNRAAGNKDFAYCAYNDAFPAGWMQNHASNQKVNWQYSGHQLTDEQKAQLKAEAAIQRQARSDERKAEHDKAAEKYAAYFQERSPAPSDHLYLQAKGIEPDGINVTPDGAALIVPLYNTQGQIRSLQYINEDGSKVLASGAEKGGNFGLVGCHIDDLAKQPKVLIAEGYATAKSLNMATGLPVVMSVDIGNMASVAKNIRKLLPEAAIAICADNDHSHKLPNGKLYNIGLDKAKIAADLVQGRLVIPYLTPNDKAHGFKDFNDIHKVHGLDALKRQMDISLNNTKKAEAALSR